MSQMSAPYFHGNFRPLFRPPSDWPPVPVDAVLFARTCRFLTHVTAGGQVSALDLVSARTLTALGDTPGAVPTTRQPYFPCLRTLSIHKNANWYEEGRGATILANAAALTLEMPLLEVMKPLYTRRCHALWTRKSSEARLVFGTGPTFQACPRLLRSILDPVSENMYKLLRRAVDV